VGTVKPFSDHSPNDDEPLMDDVRLATPHKDRLNVVAVAAGMVGIEVGRYDLGTLEWLDRWEYGTQRSIADMLHRAYEKGVADGMSRP
jgi:hypothetical protein